MTDDPIQARRLATRHRRFVDEYLVDLNAKEAAIRAGYASPTAGAVGARLLRRPEIAAEIGKARAARSENLTVTADRVLEEYARIAFADFRNLFDWGPEGVRLRPKEALSDADVAAIAGVELSASNGRGAKLRLHDKKAALDVLARHLGLFDSKTRAASSSPTIDGKEPRDVLRERLLRLVKKSDKE